MDELTARWKQSGNVWLWRYVDDPKDYPGYHLTADASGCASLCELFEAMHAAKFSARQTIRLSTVSSAQLRVPNYAGRAQTLGKWIIETSRDKFASSYWEMATIEGGAKLTIGAEQLAKLAKGIRDIAGGKGDYCIGDSEPIWFWWNRA